MVVAVDCDGTHVLAVRLVPIVDCISRKLRESRRTEVAVPDRRRLRTRNRVVRRFHIDGAFGAGADDCAALIDELDCPAVERHARDRQAFHGFVVGQHDLQRRAGAYVDLADVGGSTRERDVGNIDLASHLRQVAGDCEADGVVHVDRARVACRDALNHERTARRGGLEIDVARTREEICAERKRVAVGVERRVLARRGAEVDRLRFGQAPGDLVRAGLEVESGRVVAGYRAIHLYVSAVLDRQHRPCAVRIDGRAGRKRAVDRESSVRAKVKSAVCRPCLVGGDLNDLVDVKPSVVPRRVIRHRVGNRHVLRREVERAGEAGDILYQGLLVVSAASGRLERARAGQDVESGLRAAGTVVPVERRGFSVVDKLHRVGEYRIGLQIAGHAVETYNRIIIGPIAQIQVCSRVTCEHHSALPDVRKIHGRHIVVVIPLHVVGKGTVDFAADPKTALQAQLALRHNRRRCALQRLDCRDRGIPERIHGKRRRSRRLRNLQLRSRDEHRTKIEVGRKVERHLRIAYGVVEDHVVARIRQALRPPCGIPEIAGSRA